MVMSVDRATTNDEVIKWIDTILEAKKWSATEMSRNAGLAPSTVLRILNDENHQFAPSLKTLQKISQATNYEIPATVLQSLGVARPGTRMQTPEAPATDVAVKSAKRSAAVSHAGTVQQVASDARRLDVVHVSSLPKSLHPVMKATSTVPCPPQLETDASAFAFYQPDNSMEPFVKAGMLMYGTKRRDPVVGDMLLVTSSDGRSRVRILDNLDESGLTFRKAGVFGDDETMSFEDVKDIAIVAGTWRI